MNDRYYTSAMRLRKKLDTSDPIEALKSLHVVLRYTDAYAADQLKGYCVLLNKTKFVAINSKLLRVEQRVVAAHELGHLIEHIDQLQLGTFRDTDVYNPSSLLEREANFFAADFMLDDEEVLDEMHSNGADFFSVASSLYIPAPFFAFKLYSMVNRGFHVRVPVELDSSFLAK